MQVSLQRYITWSSLDDFDKKKIKKKRKQIHEIKKIARKKKHLKDNEKFYYMKKKSSDKKKNYQKEENIKR